jgi:hypothetical protein
VSGAPPRYRAAVIGEGRVLYESSVRERILFEARSMAEWLDFRPTWLEMRRRLLERWAHG